MKILSIHHTALLSSDSLCMEAIFGRLAEAGHEVHTVLPASGPLVPMLQARGVHVIVHPGLAILHRPRLRSLIGILHLLAALPLSILFLVRLIRALQPDVVHTNSLLMPSPAVAALLCGTPHVWHVRELPASLGHLYRPLQRLAFHLSTSVVVPSACVRDQFNPSFRHRIHITPDGVDASAFTPDPASVAAIRTPFPADAQLIGLLAPLDPDHAGPDRFGQELLIRAASLLHERAPNARFLIVSPTTPGSEAHATRLRELIATCALDGIVQLLPDTHDHPSFFAALEIAVVPSLQPEPVASLVLESMAAGTPVIGSRAGAIAEQIVPYETGLLFTPGNAEELSRDLFLLLNNPALRTRMAHAGRRRVRTHYALDTTCAAMARLFDQLLFPEPTLAHPAAASSSRATRI